MIGRHPNIVAGFIGYAFAAALTISAGVAFYLSRMDPHILAGAMSGQLDSAALAEVSVPATSMVQFRAAIAAVAYALLAALLILFGRRIFVPVIDASSAFFGTGRWRNEIVSTFDFRVVVLATAAGAALALAHLNQPMRFDESTTFLNFGTRPVYVALGAYLTPNNHILHSVLMRGSIALFGEEPWAIRLPAYLFGVAAIPLLYAAGRSAFGRETAVIAALLMAGSTYWLDLATNARGYPMLISAFLLALAVAPAALHGNALAIATVILSSSLGAMAVPVMIFPFAILIGWLGLQCLLDRNDLPSLSLALGRIVLVVAGTGLLVALLYSPALVVTGAGETGPAKLIEESTDDPVDDRFWRIWRHFDMAWEQWTYPAPWLLAMVITLLAGFGLLWAVFRPRKKERELALAILPGPLIVAAATGFSPLPYWSLGYLFPLFLLFIAGGLQALWQTTVAPVRLPLAIPVALASAWSLSTAAAGYPRTFVHAIGSPDGKEVAAAMLGHISPGAEVLARTWHFRPIQYYLRESGYRQPMKLLKVPGSQPASGRNELFVIDWANARRDIEKDRIPPDLRLAGDVVIGETRLKTFVPVSLDAGGEAALGSK